MQAEHVDHYFEILKECFESDPILIKKWHIKAGEGLDACLEQTFKDLLHCKVKVYKVTHKDDLIGYFGHEIYDGHNYLTGFMLKPKYRHLSNDFWTLISEHIKKPFLVGLYKKNLPATSFIEKHGGRIIFNTDLPMGSCVLFKVGA